MTKEEQEREDAIAWYSSRDVHAYDDGEGISVVVETGLDEVHVYVAEEEVSIRAELWRENKDEEVSHENN